MAKAKSSFYCTECGNETIKWQGRCPACGAWNTIVEQPAKDVKKKAAASASAGLGIRRPRPMAEVEAVDELRFNTGMNELDRVLGGGAVKGSLVLVGGAPGIGKSTLMLYLARSRSVRSSFGLNGWVSGRRGSTSILRPIWTILWPLFRRKSLISSLWTPFRPFTTAIPAPHRAA